MQKNHAILTGKTRSHLMPLEKEGHYLQPEVADAFKKLQQAAKKAGFNLQPASSFRDFERQKVIWNAKFTGQRKVHDDTSTPVNLNMLNDWQKCQAILRWSALPGLSRHHWGTEIDIYDPELLPQDKTLQLEPWEYEKGGYFYPLTEWLKEHAPKFGFSFCFLDLPEQYLFGREPWHLTYLPLSQKLAQQMNKQVLLDAWDNEELAGKETLVTHLDEIFTHYFIKG